MFYNKYYNTNIAISVIENMKKENYDLKNQLIYANNEFNINYTHQSMALNTGNYQNIIFVQSNIL